MKPRRAVRVEDHPEFPFSPAAREQRRAWLESFLDRPESPGLELASLRAFIEIVQRFAFLERLVQGDVQFELPVLEKLVRDPIWRPGPSDGEALAQAEADALELGDHPGAELRVVLEGRGHKLIGLSPRHDGETAPPDVEDVSGGFFFEGELGPAFFIGAPDGPEANFVVAHELGHLVADFDPYRARFCRWDRVSFANRSSSVEERRADRFARAMLLPAESLRSFLPGILQEARDREPGYALTVLATLYDVPRSVARARLIDLELIDASTQAPDSIAEPRPTRLAPASAEGEFDLPGRFTNLALACFVHRVLDEGWLGQFLGLGPEEVGELIEESGVEEHRRAAAPGEPGDERLN